MPDGDRTPELPDSDAEELCDLFEAAWRAGEGPRIEEFLTQDVASDDLLRELLAIELRYRRQLSSEPAIADYVERFPLQTDVIAEAFESLVEENSAGLSTVGSNVPLRSESESEALSEEATPSSLGRYQIRRILGQGAFGTVYLAHDPELERDVAIKVPRADRFANDAALQRFVDEARAAAKLDHPGVIRVHDVHRDTESLFVVLQFVPGRELKELIDQEQLSPKRAAELIAEIAIAVGHAHEQGLVHRDLKPANILIDEQGRPHVADLGLAIHESRQHLRRGELAGSPEYMAPEQVRGETHRLDGRTDLWALGAILYEMLSGRRPFARDSRDALFDEIENREVRPPRQYDPSIPRELERICLKCLAKRMADRYSTAMDLAEDLQYWQNAGAMTERSTPDHRAANAVEHSPVAKIIPKGLRAFDANDADFFLDLLPGPRDRDGLPDSIRFWKHRIEETDPDKTFAVGLIYGPSGCGKSSLVQAGLLPLLADHVSTIHVEATPDQTEVRLLRALRKRFPAIDTNGALADNLAATRVEEFLPDGEKVLIVLDQFEQWLHAHKEEHNTELVQALRQCDGRRVQCIIMVRDDFWLAVSRFLRALEIRLIEGHNVALADLFDLDHANRVLGAFGRAFGKSAEAGGVTSIDHNDFLQQSVLGLAEDGKVICVRLALFAEMMKGREWTPTALREVGGTKGVGVTFLEETFSSSTASPEHRYHQSAARRVLKMLLPDTGTDIKGHMRSRTDLLDISGYAHRPQDFDDLIRILDSEVRLITPTDPEGADAVDDSVTASVVGDKYYQLTHDYLVPLLREWLTRKQKESRRGRAELKLADRAALWNSLSENRHLPSWWEFLNIRALTERKSWSEAQRRMMTRAGRFHSVRAVTLLIVMAFVSWGGYETNGRFQSAALVKRLASASEDRIAEILAELPPYQRWATPRLRDRLTVEATTSQERRAQVNVRLGLVGDNPAHVDPLIEELLSGSVAYVGVIRDVLAQSHKDVVAKRLWETFHQFEEDATRRFRASLALAVYTPASEMWTDDDFEFVATRLVKSIPETQPQLRSYLRPLSGRLLEPLEQRFHDRAAPESDQLSAANALADFAGDDALRMAHLLTDASAAQFGVLYPLVADSTNSDALSILTKVVEGQPAESLSPRERASFGRRRAFAAIALLRRGKHEEILQVLRVQDDPESLTQFAHGCRARGVTPADLLECLSEADAQRQPQRGNKRRIADRVLYGLLLALGEFDVADVPESSRGPLVEQIAGWYARDPSSMIHGATGWLLRAWGLEAKAREIEYRSRPYDPKREWFTIAVRTEGRSSEGTTPTLYFTFVVIAAGEYVIGSPADEPQRDSDEFRSAVRLTRPVAILDREITRGEFETFVGQSFRGNPQIESVSPSVEHVATRPSWYDGVRFCRWLTKQAGLEEDAQSYANPQTLDRDEFPRDRNPDSGGAPLNWPLRLDRPGFRLPTDVEWEIACRAGTRSAYSFGEDARMLDRYGWYQSNAEKRAHRPRRLRPNLFGLFDLHGNVNEWCHDWYAATRVDRPTGPAMGSSRVPRGGSWGNAPEYCRSAHRFSLSPARRNSILGFRIAFVPSAGRDATPTTEVSD